MTASPNVGSGANVLTGVAASSGADAWAVGYYFNGTYNQPLMEHWNGSAWSVTSSPSPSPNGDARLLGVAATSASDVWAVGHDHTSCGERALIEHWNGTAWSVIPGPNPAGCANSNLFGVAAVSANDAWAVGNYDSGSVKAPLVEYWNGSTWTVLPSPNPGAQVRLTGVAAASPSDAWAVGHYYTGTHDMTVLEHWNGITWQLQPAIAGDLYGVSAISASDVRAVGECATCKGPITGGTLVEKGNGTIWQIQPSPNAGPYQWGNLYGVAGTSSSDVWTVGDYPDHKMGATGPQPTLIEHWNGNTWSIVPSPSPGTTSCLNGVATISPTNAWAVGSYSNTGPSQTLIEHWNGVTWQR